MEYGGISDGELAQIQAQRFNEARLPASEDAGRISLLQRQVAILEKQVGAMWKALQMLSTHEHHSCGPGMTSGPRAGQR